MKPVKLRLATHPPDGAVGSLMLSDDTDWPYLHQLDPDVASSEWRRMGQAYLHLVNVESYYTDSDAQADLLKVRRAIRAERKNRKVKP